MTYRRKLIEVALPLKEINEQSAREKSIRHGHPSTLHLWWARRPLAACRAVLFASIVDDPSSREDLFPTTEEQAIERERLFNLIRRMVVWENANDEDLLKDIRAEIRRSTDGNPPAVADPFCGGGSIPLEAQRLGLKAYASDLNPVAVLITKALIEIPPLFAGMPPVHPADEGKAQTRGGTWKGATGLAEDVRYYGEWMRQRAIERIGHLYPKAKLADGSEAVVITWLWARTIVCPNPACHFPMPLMRSFDLSKKKGRERHLEPVIDKDAKRMRFEITPGPSKRPATVGRTGAECLACGQPVALSHIREASRNGKMRSELLAMVVDRGGGREYLPADALHESTAARAKALWEPEGELFDWPGRINVVRYGMTTWADLFTPRQLTALTTLSDLIEDARTLVLDHATSSGLPNHGGTLANLDNDAQSYADAVSVYLTLAVSKCTDYGNALNSWAPGGEFIKNLFSRQAIPMTWDHAETAPLADSSGSFANMFGWVATALASLPTMQVGSAQSADASSLVARQGLLISTDPPYYDNIAYADLADFFYAWLRSPLRSVFPSLTSTIGTPKQPELVANPYRFPGGRDEARSHFEHGLRRAFDFIKTSSHPEYPITIYYAYKQEEQSDNAGRISTGWETMLESLLASGLRISGTWPMRTERAARMLANETNALASSIVLVCRPRPDDASTETRQNFVRRLRDELPSAVKELQQAALPPVDLGQAAIGPGMAIYSSYAKVLEPDGSRMPVRAALGLINQALEEILSAFDAELDEPTRFLVRWYEQAGYGEGSFDDANKLANTMATAVDALKREGLLRGPGGKVALVGRDELPSDWDPTTDKRLTAWEACMHLVRRMEAAEGGVRAAGKLATALGGHAEVARDLAYRLHQIATQRGWIEDAIAFNALVVEWPEIVGHSVQSPSEPTIPGMSDA